MVRIGDDSSRIGSNQSGSSKAKLLLLACTAKRSLLAITILASLFFALHSDDNTNTTVTSDLKFSHAPASEGSDDQTADDRRHAPASAVSSAMTSVSDSNDMLINDLISWLLSNGAFIDTRLSIQHIDPTDPSSVRGIFAAHGSFEKDEILISIPHDLVYDSVPRPVKKNANKVWRDTDEDHGDCGTTYEIHDAMQTGNTPYGRYLAHQPRRYVPGYWASEVSRNLLGTILGDHLAPRFSLKDRAQRDWIRYCDGATNDELEIHAAMLVTARADGRRMVPYYDMINHRNGYWYNAQHDGSVEDHFSLSTNRRVEKGEQFYLPYNTCTICGSRNDFWGTIEMFRDYGFVEPYPQRYVFESVRLKFALDEKKSIQQYNKPKNNADDNEYDGLVVKWYAPLSQEGLDFLKTELGRLQKVGKTKEELKRNVDGEENILESEWNASWMLHQAMVVAFRTALEQTPAVSGDVWKMEEDEWYKDRSGVEPPNRFY